jgi:26S proteasome regulatory subunit N10
MPDVTIALFDNSLYAQNQDYLPSRFILQKETVETIISRKLEENRENLVGIIPLAQPKLNEILTPTKQRTHLNNFLNNLELSSRTDLIKSLVQAAHSFNQREIPDKILLVFLGSKLEDALRSEFFAKVYELLTYGITVKIVFFGESSYSCDLFRQQIEFTNFGCIRVGPNEDFCSLALSLLNGEEGIENDPELAEAIRLSLEEQNRQK